MKLKGFIIVVCMILLCGCQSSSSKGGLDMYKGKDGKDTYQTALKHFNETVKYYRVESSESGSDSVNEVYMTSNGCFSMNYSYSSKSSAFFIASAIGNDKRNLVMSSTSGDLTVSEMNWDVPKEMLVDLTNVDGIVIKSIDRIEDVNGITLNIKIERTVANNKDYCVNSFIINKKGLIESRQTIDYTDNTFSKVKKELPIETYIDINKVSESEFMKKYDTYVEGIKACDGLTATQGYNKLKPLL